MFGRVIGSLHIFFYQVDSPDSTLVGAFESLSSIYQYITCFVDSYKKLVVALLDIES
jgi:hypothetical protein